MSSKVELHSFETSLAPKAVEYAVILPPGYEPDGPPVPVCLVLHGGGGNRDNLVDSQPLFDALWAGAERHSGADRSRWPSLPRRDTGKASFVRGAWSMRTGPSRSRVRSLSCCAETGP